MASGKGKEPKNTSVPTPVKPEPTTSIGTQTVLTIPTSIDLMIILGSEFMYKEDNTPSSLPSCSKSSLRDLDVMSKSSLKRKAAEKDCKTPSRFERKDPLVAKQWSTPTINMKSIQSAPSDLLSCTPITPATCSKSSKVRKTMAPKTTTPSINSKDFLSSCPITPATCSKASKVRTTPQMPSMTDSSTKRNTDLEVRCQKCKLKYVGSKAVFLWLPCSHVICRPCEKTMRRQGKRCLQCNARYYWPKCRQFPV